MNKQRLLLLNLHKPFVLALALTSCTWHPILFLDRAIQVGPLTGSPGCVPLGAWWWEGTAPCYRWPSAWPRQTRTGGGATHPASPWWMMQGNTWEVHTHIHMPTHTDTQTVTGHQGQSKAQARKCVDELHVPGSTDGLETCNVDSSHQPCFLTALISLLFTGHFKYIFLLSSPLQLGNLFLCRHWHIDPQTSDLTCTCECDV